MAAQRLRLIDRTKEQAMARFKDELARAGITDTSDGEAAIRIANLFGEVLEQNSLTIDYKADQVMVDSMTRLSNAIMLARQFGYPVGGTRKARVPVDITVTPAQNFNVAGLQLLETADGIQYKIADEPGIRTGGQFTVWLEEYTSETGFLEVTASGDPDLQLSLAGLPEEADSESITVKVATEPWQRVDTLILSGATDKHFMVQVQPNGLSAVVFGDGITGLAVPANALVRVDYDTTRADEGNILAQTELLPGTGFDQGTGAGAFDPGTEFKIVTRADAVGGRLVESLESIRANLKRWNRTQDRAIHADDFADLLMVSPFRVARAKAAYRCKEKVFIHVRLLGGQPMTSQEKANMEAWLKRKMALGLVPELLDAGLVHVIQEWTIRIRDGYRQSVGVDSARAAMASYMSLGTDDQPGLHDIQGSIKIGNLYQIMEGVEEVDYSQLNAIYAVPYAEPIRHTNQLQFTVRPSLEFRGASVKYKIHATSTTQYGLYRANTFFGQFSVNDQVILPEGIMKVTGGLVAGKDWTFIMYPTGGSLELLEPSIPTSDPDDILITATGGF